MAVLTLIAAAMGSMGQMGQMGREVSTAGQKAHKHSLKSLYDWKFSTCSLVRSAYAPTEEGGSHLDPGKTPSALLTCGSAPGNSLGRITPLHAFYMLDPSPPYSPCRPIH